MLDVAAYIGVSLSEIAAMLLVRSVGSVVGSVASGIIFDKFYKVSLWMLIFCISSGAICKWGLFLIEYCSIFKNYFKIY